MDDLEKKLDALLSSPDGMKRIEELMTAFGASGDAPKPPPSLPMGDGMPDITQYMKLMPMLGALQTDNDDTALLHALRPHLHHERQKRLDEAQKLLKMMRLMPLLRELGKEGDADG